MTSSPRFGGDHILILYARPMEIGILHRDVRENNVVLAVEESIFDRL